MVVVKEEREKKKRNNVCEQPKQHNQHKQQRMNNNKQRTRYDESMSPPVRIHLRENYSMPKSQNACYDVHEDHRR